jgi:glutathione S-transferase
MSERVVYVVNGSIPNWRVLLGLYEKKLAFTVNRLKVMRAQRETRTPEFLALNPRGQTPLLIEPDGTKINESLAILTYLELRYPEPALLPSVKEPQDLANALAWVQEAETFACAYDPLESLFVTKPEDLNQEQREEIRSALKAIDFDLNLWESRAAKHKCIVSDQFTLADCSFYPVLAYLLRRGLTLEKYPKLREYELRVRERDSARAAYPEGWKHDQPSKMNLFQLAKGV